MTYTPYQPTNYFAYGSIPIDRDQLIELRLSTTIPNYQSDRVVFPTKIINKGNDLDRIGMKLRLSELELVPWLAQYNNLPTGLQQTLKLGTWETFSYAIEKMRIDYTDFVPLGNNDFYIYYTVDIEFLRSV